MNNIDYLKNEADKLIKERELQEKEIIKLSNDILLKYQDIIIQALESRIIVAISKQEKNISFSIFRNIMNCLTEEYGKDYYHILSERFNILDSPVWLLEKEIECKISKLLISKGYYITKTKIKSDSEYYDYIYWDKNDYKIAKFKYMVSKLIP